jgi:hypothetical protein
MESFMQVIEKGWNGSQVIVAVSFLARRYRPPQSFIFIEQAERADSTFVQNPSFSSTRSKRPITKRLVGKKINCIFSFTKEEAESLKNLTISIIIGKVKEDTLTIDMTDVFKTNQLQINSEEIEQANQEEADDKVAVLNEQEPLKEQNLSLATAKPAAKQKQMKNSPKPIKRIEE